MRKSTRQYTSSTKKSTKKKNERKLHRIKDLIAMCGSCLDPDWNKQTKYNFESLLGI